MTHLQLLQKLPSPIREQAIENCKLTEWTKAKGTSLLDTLSGAFSWANSPQGLKYWLEVKERIRAGEFDDPSVTLPREDWEWLSNVVEFNPNPKAKGIFEAIQQQLKP